MVIECPACKTKFKLPDDKVGPNGVSVRCSKCSTTFAVRPPAAAAPAPAPAPATPPVDPTRVSPPTPPANPFDQTRVSAPPPVAPPAEPTRPSAGNPFAAGDPFASAPPATPPVPPPAPANPAAGGLPPGFGGMSPAFAAGMAATAPTPAPVAGFGTPFVGTPGAGAGTLPGMPPAAPVSSAPVDDPSTLADESEMNDTQASFDPNMRAQLFGDTSTSALTEEGDPGLGASPAAAAGAPGAPPDNLSGGMNFDFGANPFDTLPQAGAPGGSAQPAPAPPPAELFARAPAQPPPAAPHPSAPHPAAEPPPSLDVAGGPAAEKKRPEKKPAKKPQPKLATARMSVPQEPVRAYRMLLILFFVGAAVSAFASLTDGTFEPSRLDRGRLSLLIGPPETPETLQGLAITARRGGYVTTPPGKPRVYTAHGVAVNAGAAPKGFLEVRGRILDEDGGVLAESTAPCGNSFRDDQLLGFRSGDDLKRAYLPAGDGSSNAKLAPGSAVSCTVVFYEAPAPEKTARFELEIIAAQPVS